MPSLADFFRKIVGRGDYLKRRKVLAHAYRMILIMSLNVPSLNDLDINSQSSAKEKQEIKAQHLAKIPEIKKRVLTRINANSAHIKLRQTYKGLPGISVQAKSKTPMKPKTYIN